MRIGAARKRFCVAVVLCAAACACAVQTAETVGRGAASAAPAFPQDASAFDPALCVTAAFGDASEARLADIGRQVLDPAGCTHPFSDAASAQTLTLPAVPAAIALTLFGFFCVSLARDRRAWLALAAGLIWLGQAGMHTLPQLAQRLCARTSRQTTQNQCLSLSLITGPQPTGRDEQTSYAGLLHKLAAIPDHASTFTSSMNAKASRRDLATDGRSLASAIIASPWQDMANECPAGAAGHLVRFSPAFTFQNLARGPPARSL
ncbi:MAG: hypothetical protein IH624_04710 [Phycisphaerae bacterium]|nr:hypothetical protein [Phycisphaerae bacterium]